MVVRVGAVSSLQTLTERGLIAPDWAEALADVDDTIGELGAFLRDEVAAGSELPPRR